LVVLPEELVALFPPPAAVVLLEIENDLPVLM